MAKAKRKRKKKRTPAQQRATRKMIAALRKKRRGGKRKKRSTPKRRKRRTNNPNPKRRSASMAKRKRRRRRSRRGGGIATGKEKAYLTAGAAAYGYADNHIEAFDRLPVLDAVGPHISRGVILHYIAKNTDGEVSRWADLMSVGALSIGGYNLGKARGNLQEAAAMEGVPDVDVRGSGHDEVGGTVE